MTDESKPHPFNETMQKAGVIVGGLFEAAVQGLDSLVADLGELTDVQVHAALVFTVLLDRDQQAGKPARFSIDLPALDALATAAEESVSELRDAVLELPVETARDALGELVYLHREIKLTEAVARTSAQFN